MVLIMSLINQFQFAITVSQTNLNLLSANTFGNEPVSVFTKFYTKLLSLNRIASVDVINKAEFSCYHRY